MPLPHNQGEETTFIHVHMNVGYQCVDSGGPYLASAEFHFDSSSFRSDFFFIQEFMGCKTLLLSTVIKKVCTFWGSNVVNICIRRWYNRFKYMETTYMHTCICTYLPTYLPTYLVEGTIFIHNRQSFYSVGVVTRDRRIDFEL
jgi:hypothetical protein